MHDDATITVFRVGSFTTEAAPPWLAVIREIVPKGNAVWRCGEVMSTFDRTGRYVGAFMVPHNVAARSQGNMYMTEMDTGQRVQRFRRAEPGH